MCTPGGQTKSQRMPEGEKTVAVVVAVAVSCGLGLANTEVARRLATKKATEVKRILIVDC